MEEKRKIFQEENSCFIKITTGDEENCVRPIKFPEKPVCSTHSPWKRTPFALSKQFSKKGDPLGLQNILERILNLLLKKDPVFLPQLPMMRAKFDPQNWVKRPSAP